MKKQVLRGVILGALATMTAGVSTMAQADGTASLDLTVNANITAGTCS
ncbi:fimbrial protein, partial [Salmonella enterica subsp. enterica serovar Schwarzengrund]|nr:fimbrial protein [Salmonella enterica subsp. enterica serovar Schwarzengrund]ELF8145457.1 fimbrial protein [Salmonella enterica]EGS4078156.1 fimbrial protein [Salmonella enterica subsp. enterica serovar Schwarzengrund]EHN5398392.1 fimbrial protein [Salmonella enterica subsp. enterica serovar Schwarzengrund]EHT1705051.1 fimbrial protein [Salmonella enterica subsp. enterica serovar Schwarzengrund]